MRSRPDVKRLTALALLTAMALAVQYLESLLPPLIPGVPVRAGFANVFVLYALLRMTRADALALTLLRSLLFALITGAVSGLMYSLAGGTLSFFAMALLLPLVKRGQLTAYGLSVAGAFLFNLGQCAVGLFIVGRAMLWYLPWMGLLSIPAGLVTALAASIVIRRVRAL